MATQVITDPVMLDSTGQDIVSALNGIASAVKPDADDISTSAIAGQETVEDALAYLDANDVKTIAQTLTDAKKAQARTNIGAQKAVLKPSTAFAIPASGSSASYNMEGLTASHEVARWNFSSSADNSPPTDLTITTYAGYFTVSNTGSESPDETIQPVFVDPTAIAITTHS